MSSLLGPDGEDAIAQESKTIVDGLWGYACLEPDAVYIPVIQASEEWPMRRVLAHLHACSGLTRFIFSAVLNPDKFRPHLRNIVREWNEYVEEMGDYSYCIEIVYEPPQSVGAVDPHAEVSNA